MEGDELQSVRIDDTRSRSDSMTSTSSDSVSQRTLSKPFYLQLWHDMQEPIIKLAEMCQTHQDIITQYILY